MYVLSEQPQIRYATAPDGVRIAYWTLGDGTPLIHMPPVPLSNIRKEWGFPACRDYYERLAEGLRLVRYDCRGAGLSDREVIDYSLDAHIEDVLAVADRLGLKRFGLLGFGHSGLAAITLAALHPDRVSHLVLWCSYPRGTDYGRGASVQASRSLMDQNWDFWTKTEGYRLSEWEGGETSRWFTEWVRESVSAAGLRAAISALRKADVTALLPKVRAPSLVLHRTGLEAITVEMAKEMASTIPGARLLLLDGPSIVPYLGTKGDEIAEMIRTFVAAPANEALEATRSSSPLTPRETEILRLIAAGRTSSEISRELSLSVRTVGRHITNIYGKIEANSRAEATAYALNHGIA